MLKLISYLFIVSIISSQALAIPLPKKGEFSKRGFKLPSDFNSNYNFEGIVSLSNCSGSLVKFENSYDHEFALVLTNGHCIKSNSGGFLRPGEVVYNRSETRSFGLFNKDIQKVGTVVSSHLAYATMTKTDMAIYRLNQTYGEIRSQYGIEALTISSVQADTTVGMEVLSGYWKKGYSCRVDGFVDILKEADWTWNDSIRYSKPGCETIGGTSGSPIVQAGTRTVIGVNNTGNEDGQNCTMNNPCEVQKDGSTIFKKGTSYGQQIFWVYSCLTTNNEINLKQEGCLLPN